MAGMMATAMIQTGVPAANGLISQPRVRSYLASSDRVGCAHIASTFTSHVRGANGEGRGGEAHTFTSEGTVSFGVSIATSMSSAQQTTIAMITEKSAISTRHYAHCSLQRVCVRKASE